MSSISAELNYDRVTLKHLDIASECVFMEWFHVQYKKIKHLLHMKPDSQLNKIK